VISPRPRSQEYLEIFFFFGPTAGTPLLPNVKPINAISLRTCPSGGGKGKCDKCNMANILVWWMTFHTHEIDGMLSMWGEHMPEDITDHTCPYCQQRPIETIATLPYVRGNGLGADFNAKTITGCKSCVRKNLLRETLRSSVDGWASPTALLTNPVMIACGVARAGAVRVNPERVDRMLDAAGIRNPRLEQNPVRIAYSLAAALIAADGKIEPQEIATATKIGRQLFADFDEQEFLQVISVRRDLPTPDDLAILLNKVVNEATKQAVFKYLVTIAAADDEVALEEQRLLMRIAGNLGLTGSGHGLDQSV
jgi:uncharacterized tellurite resistance protein B-like protein